METVGPVVMLADAGMYEGEEGRLGKTATAHHGPVVCKVPFVFLSVLVSHQCAGVATLANRLVP